MRLDPTWINVLAARTGNRVLPFRIYAAQPLRARLAGYLQLLTMPKWPESERLFEAMRFLLMETGQHPDPRWRLAAATLIASYHVLTFSRDDQRKCVDIFGRAVPNLEMMAHSCNYAMHCCLNAINSCGASDALLTYAQDCIWRDFDFVSDREASRLSGTVPVEFLLPIWTSGVPESPPYTEPHEA